MKGFKIIAVISDIHIGVPHISAKTFKAQLQAHFLDVLDNMAILDGIFILGDILHTAISMNSEYAEVFHWFIDNVYKIARLRKATVVIIRGTLSHDCGQLAQIKHYENNMDFVDFRIYDTIEEITLWDNYKALVLPDVRVKDLKDVGKYLNEPGKYDMILGHGMIEQMQYVQQETENMPTKTYVYDVKKLVKASKGPVLFGHVHQYQHYKNHFYYVGPFTLLERGGIDAGFAVVGICDEDRTKFKVEHYINPDSAAYYDLVVTRKILREIPIDEIIAAIDEVANDAKSNDLITLRITRGDETEAADKVLMLESRYRYDKRFSIVKKIKTAKEAEWEEQQNERRNKYAYLMDEGIELPEILYIYYTNEVKPTIPDATSTAATLEEADFTRFLKGDETL